MRVAGIICEYNPFHLGHEWMLQQLRRDGVEAIVCVMSGNFVQRGEVAVADKFARAEMAVRCGADLVLELPTPWAAATAEIFARGGIDVLRRTGVVTDLAFGSECGDAAALQQLAAVLDSPAYDRQVQLLLRSGDSFAACRQQAVERLAGGELAALLEKPNNNLAVEYCCALRRSGLDWKVTTVARRGAPHDGAPAEGVASASHIRSLLWAGAGEEALSFLPAAAARVLQRELDAGRAPASLAHCERAVLARLRTLSAEDFIPFGAGSEGLYHRVYQAVRSGTDLESVLSAAKTKRYSHARLRRILLSAWLELEAPGPLDRVPYLRVLAAGEQGRRLLRQMQRAGAPVLTKAADVGRLGREAEAFFTREALRTDLYTLAFPRLGESACGRDWRSAPKML